MTHFLDWFLIGWVLLSALATPFVGRFVASRLGEDDEASPVLSATQLPNPKP